MAVPSARSAEDLVVARRGVNAEATTSSDARVRCILAVHTAFNPRLCVRRGIRGLPRVPRSGAPMAHHDPYKNFRFRVKLDGRTVAGFSDAEVHASLAKVHGLGKSADITLKRGVMAAQSVWKWLGGVSCNDPASRKNIELV